MIRILFLTEGKSVPSTRFRVLPLVSYLRKRGIECIVRHCYPNKYLVSNKRVYSPVYDAITTISRLIQIYDASRFDWVFLQRDLTRWKSSWLEKLLMRRNKNIIFDLDDAQWLFSSTKKIREISKLSRIVLAGNRNLQQYFLPIKSIYCPTSVDLSRYPLHKPNNRKKVVIGWTGTAFSHQFFEGFRPIFNKIFSLYDAEIHIISNSGKIRELDGLPVRYTLWSTDNEISEMRDFDIGIMPLPDNTLTRYKCGLKLVQYMALGIPSVASAVGANVDIIKEGETGFLCKSDEQWINSLRNLVENPIDRKVMGRNARLYAEKHFSIESVSNLITSIVKPISKT